MHLPSRNAARQRESSSDTRFFSAPPALARFFSPTFDLDSSSSLLHPFPSHFSLLSLFQLVVDLTTLQLTRLYIQDEGHSLRYSRRDSRLGCLGPRRFWIRRESPRSSPSCQVSPLGSLALPSISRIEKECFVDVGKFLLFSPSIQLDHFGFARDRKRCYPPPPPPIWQPHHLCSL